ncbi:probable protein phosphatase 2C 33 [Rutidosis leptorrhynchoides]|uniref:probable protein phosphatase 2C 33 n=1 Tax=Rutidosis leptorrhynchoides TaxID=125765 RepID=UPI003A9A1162
MGSCLSGESRSPHPSSPTTPNYGKKRKNLKKKTSRSSSFNTQREDHLHRIPGRMFLNGSSEVASLFTQQGKKGTNQDAMIVWENFGSRTDTVFCGVFDGHGPYGHMVAKRVRDSLPLKLSANWEVNKQGSGDVIREVTFNEETPIACEVFSDLEISKNPEKLQALKDLFMKAFKVMDRELRMYANIDCFCSGTTAVTLIKQGQDLIIGNVGDSRAILCTRDKTNSLIAVQLTVDLKPNLPAEAERIRKCKGRVFALQDEPGVSRVWLPNNDSPGLAMARAFGDFCLKDFGLISVPDIFYRHLTENDLFVVLATDGIWDVLTNKDVVDIVASAETRSCAARDVVQSAVRAWKYKYPTSKVDDCAVVCLFLTPQANNVSTASTTDLTITFEKNEPVSLKPSDTVRASDRLPGDVTDADDDVADDVADDDLNDDQDVNAEGGIDWSALEGVSRVNTLLTLPRFVPEEADKQTMQQKKTD